MPLVQSKYHHIFLKNDKTGPSTSSDYDNSPKKSDRLLIIYHYLHDGEGGYYCTSTTLPVLFRFRIVHYSIFFRYVPYRTVHSYRSHKTQTLKLLL